MKQNNQSTSPKNYFRKSVSSFLKSFVYLEFGFYNLARRGYDKLTKNAVLAIYFVSVAFLLVGWLITYADMKTRLTTQIWRSDSLKLKLDSINELNSKTAEYSKFVYK